MFDAIAPAPAPVPDQARELSGADLALRLPADAYYHLVRTLRLTLPPPLTDDPEDLARRDHAAIARIAALAPANAAEADIAAQFVAASEQWKECLRLAQDPATTPEWSMKCRAQANSMMRQANAALRLLLRMQDARRKLEADTSARDRLAWTEHCAIGLMAEALAPEGEAPAPPREPAVAERPEPPRAAAPNRGAAASAFAKSSHPMVQVLGKRSNETVMRPLSPIPAIPLGATAPPSTPPASRSAGG